MPSLQEDCEIFVNVSFMGDNFSCVELSLVGKSESGSDQCREFLGSCCNGFGHGCQVPVSGGIRNSSDRVDLKGNLLSLLQ